MHSHNKKTFRLLTELPIPKVFRKDLLCQGLQFILFERLACGEAFILEGLYKFLLPDLVFIKPYELNWVKMDLKRADR